jgi:hypothetical protein
MTNLLPTYTAFSFIPPCSLTAISLYCCLSTPHMPSTYSIPDREIHLIQNRSWESPYTPTSTSLNPLDYTDNEKLEILQNFAVNLTSDMKDIPVDFARVLYENFWELV